MQSLQYAIEGLSEVLYKGIAEDVFDALFGETAHQNFGTRDGRRLNTAPFERVLEHIDWQPRVMARGLYSPACHAKGKRTKRRRMAAQGCRSHHAFVEAIKLQGLPAGWDLPGFKLKEKFRAVGNAVPYPMALALAKAVKLALTDPVESLAANA